MDRQQEIPVNRFVDAFIAWPARVASPLRPVGPLLARLTVGWVFLWSGWGKLGALEQVIENFRGWGIPAPEVLAPFVSASSSSAASCCWSVCSRASLRCRWRSR